MQQVVYQLYGNVSRRTATETVNELAVFRQITDELEVVARQDLPNPGLWGDALSRNNQLWTILSQDLMHEGNQLPFETKQGLLRLALFVICHTQDVYSGKADVDTLIEINRTVMEGLEKKPFTEVA